MKVALTGGFYKAKSIIAGAQRCVNLYPEINPKDSPFPVTHYQRPGLVELMEGEEEAQVFGTYTTSTGVLLVAIGTNLYRVEVDDDGIWQPTLILTLSAVNQLSMIDNGLVVIVVDGSTDGYVINLATPGYTPWIAAGIHGAGLFYGADKVDYLDGFFLFNKPASREFYSSVANADYAMFTGGPIEAGTLVGGSGYTNGTYTGVALVNGSGTGATANITVAGGIVTVCTIADPGSSYREGDVLTCNDIGAGTGFTFTLTETGSSAFDALDIAAKNGGADPLATLIVMHREIWLLGTKTTEVWYNAGAPDFPFQAMSGVFIEHGCAAIRSVAKADLSIFWLAQDIQGHAIVLEGNQYAAKRISTHALETELSSYAQIDDAIGFTYQVEGHVFYQLNFPKADKTWVYDMATQLWHEETWTDGDGAEHRSRLACAAFAYGTNVGGDHSNGLLYKIDQTAYTDDGDPIVFRRGFPHLLNDGKRVFYRAFVAEMQVGTVEGRLTEDEPEISLRWSDTRGASWSNPIRLGIGSTGEYLRQVQAQRLGMARDRVFEIYWDGDFKTALNGAWIDLMTAGT